MERAKFGSIEEYVASFPADVQNLLTSIRSAFIEAAPEAEEGMSYQMPVLKQDGVLLWYAAFKRHLSVFVPHSKDVLQVFAAELKPYRVEKNIIKLPLDQPPPLDLLQRIIRYRIEENAAEAEAKREAKAAARRAAKK